MGGLMNQTVQTPECVSAHLLCSMKGEARYLLIRRCSPYLCGTWQMVSGKIEAGERAWEAALREIWEETGIVPDRFYSADTVETFYLKSQDKILNCPVFVGIVSSLSSVTLSPQEHDAYEWVDLETAMKKLVWSEQRRVLAHIHQEFFLKEPNPLLQIEEHINKK
jgi:dihydroneopterin triphosphate diphosphatase